MSSPTDFTFNLNISDMTALARQNKLPSNQPVNEQAVTRLVQVLTRRARINAFLLSEDRMSRLVLVETLSRRIVNGTVPEPLLEKRVLSLAVEEFLVKNTAEQQEQQLSQMFSIVKPLNVIVFADEFHLLVNANDNVWRLFNAYAARYEIQFIGGTTIQEYEQSTVMEGNMRRFQPISLII